MEQPIRGWPVLCSLHVDFHMVQFPIKIRYNPSISSCWKGCDYGTGRVNDDVERVKAERMCKQYTTEAMYTRKGELDNIEDLRVHSEMFPTEPKNIYRACLAGIRRQKF